MNLTCPGCNSRHDVSGRPAGTLVSCRCGETFGFPAPVGTLVSLQCNGCGAQADPSQARCAYCDNVLNCVCCPSCFALMASDARHCVACGTRVESPALAVHRHGAPTLPCPRCAGALTANLVGNHLFDRCDGCGGIWAHHLALAGVFAARGQRYRVADWLARVRPPAHSASQGALVPCPDCERPMQRQAIARRADLVVDSCNDHGIWFDYSELRRIVGPAGRDANTRRTPDRPRRRRGKRDLDDWWPFEALEELVEFLEDVLD